MTANDLTLDDELASLLTPHAETELGHLEESLRANGLLSPLLVWPHEHRLVLLDGFARLKIAVRLRLPIHWTEVPLPDRDAAVEFRLRQQMSRRNLPPIAQAYLRGRLYLLAGKRQGARTDLPKGKDDAQMTARGVGERFGVSERTIRREQRLAQAIDRIGRPDQLGPEFKALLLAGKSNITRRGLLQMDRMSQIEQQRVLERMEQEQAARRARPRQKPAATPKATDSTSGTEDDTSVAAGPGNCDAALVARWPDDATVAADPRPAAPAGGLPSDLHLHHADNRTFEWPDIDLCFTDPPYADFPAYEWLGGMLSRKLRPGRLALVYADGFRLPEQIRLLTVAGLRYITTFGITYPQAFGGKPLLGFISNNIRPVVLLSQGKPTRPERLVYAARVQEQYAKTYHPWQQALEPAVEWIRRLARPGDLVADPFLGSGTTAVAVRRIGGLRFVGTESNKSTHRTAVGRLAEGGVA
jgi:hypothetical protein